MKKKLLSSILLLCISIKLFAGWSKNIRKIFLIGICGFFMTSLQAKDNSNKSLEENSVSIEKSIKKFYETGVEKDRLFRKMGRLEKERTDQLLNQYLPKAPATILDVGGGVGVYSFDLTKKGYNIYLIDPVEANIKEAKKLSQKSKNNPLRGYIVGDARKIDMDDDSADVVLFMGPLYHLDKHDRKIALLEAYRVLKPGGKIFAVAISRFCPVLGAFVKEQMEDESFSKEVFNCLTQGHFFYKGGHFFSHWPNELQNEVKEAGFENISIHPIEGFGYCLDKSNWENEDLRKKLLKAIELTETESSILGVSDHMMAIGEKSK